MADKSLEFSKRIRQVERDGETYYSLVDICAEFTDTAQARRYWTETKKRLERDGFELLDNIEQLKMRSSDGKLYRTDAGTRETCLRIVQSIPSPKAEPIRQWLAQLGNERIDESADPTLGMSRALKRYAAEMEQRGMSGHDALVALRDRLDSIITRNEFTAIMKAVIIDTIYYGKMTNVEYKGLFGRTAKQITEETGAKNARDTMPPEGLAFVRAAEAACTRLLKGRETITFNEACEIMHHVASAIGVNVDALQQVLGIDLATGRPLLK